MDVSAGISSSNCYESDEAQEQSAQQPLVLFLAKDSLTLAGLTQQMTKQLTTAYKYVDVLLE